MEPTEKLYLGLDFGTQSAKAVVVNDKLDLVQEISVKFDQDLPEFGTNGGVNKDTKNIKIVTAQPIMWVKAVDILMEKLRVTGVPMENIVAISGAAQQHGSVYWRRGSEETLKTLDPTKFLHEQLAFSFSVQHSPVWMDSSTSEFCHMLEKHVGGPQKLAQITGSRAYERFTGSQIAKIFHTRRDAYNMTERISLVSSFLCSVLLGQYAPIDYSDGSGMNLLDIRTKAWSPDCLQGITNCENVENLLEKLGSPVPTETVLGTVSPYFQERFGFNENCKVVAFTGDNPSSFAGMALGPSDIAVSLGTSDTLFVSMEKLPSQGFTEGHIFVNPIASETHYMALLCFRNGSLTRERIKRNYSDNSWKIFNELLNITPRGNFGYIGMYFDLWEILPKIKNGDHRYNKMGEKLTRFTSNEVEVRSVIEGQFLSRRIHAEQIGLKITKDTRILATGGASNNKHILQILSDVFNAPVYVQETANSADLGACYRAKHALTNPSIPFTEVIGDNHGFVKMCDPHSDSEDIYDPMAKRYKEYESELITRN